MSVSSTANSLLAQNPLIKGRHAPDFSQTFSLSSDDQTVLSMRGLSQSQQETVSGIYAQARSAVQGGQGKSFLSGLDTQSLALLQQAACLADPVQVSSLSEEGAENLLLAPTEAVDLNGDGMIQTGAATGFNFPPANASAELRAAWEKTASGMSEGDAMTLSLMLSGPRISVDGSEVKGRDFSSGFDWNGYMTDLVSGNDLSKAYNTPEQYQKVSNQLQSFWAALKEQGLA